MTTNDFECFEADFNSDDFSGSEVGIFFIRGLWESLNFNKIRFYRW